MHFRNLIDMLFQNESQKIASISNKTSISYLIIFKLCIVETRCSNLAAQKFKGTRQLSILLRMGAPTTSREHFLQINPLSKTNFISQEVDHPTICGKISQESLQ